MKGGRHIIKDEGLVHFIIYHHYTFAFLYTHTHAHTHTMYTSLQ